MDEPNQESVTEEDSVSRVARAVVEVMQEDGIEVDPVAFEADVRDVVAVVQVSEQIAEIEKMRSDAQERDLERARALADELEASAAKKVPK